MAIPSIHHRTEGCPHGPFCEACAARKTSQALAFCECRALITGWQEPQPASPPGRSKRADGMTRKWRRLTAGLRDVAKRLAQARARLAAAEAAEQGARDADESLNFADAATQGLEDGADTTANVLAGSSV